MNYNREIDGGMMYIMATHEATLLLEILIRGTFSGVTKNGSEKIYLMYTFLKASKFHIFQIIGRLIINLDTIKHLIDCGFNESV